MLCGNRLAEIKVQHSYQRGFLLFSIFMCEKKLMAFRICVVRHLIQGQVSVIVSHIS
jgi:hypothetical protein